MSEILLREYEIMWNPALGCNALWAFTQGFISRPSQGQLLTIWHLVSVLPLVFHDTTRKIILKRRKSSGLRSILDRDPANSIAQNESVFNINNRIEGMKDRTFRSLNLAIACNLITFDEGYFTSSVPFKLLGRASDETKAILNASYKLGIWAGNMSVFEYLTILGVDCLT
ncbi:hypothetical protein BXT84_03030 [Sulfobacillus thermotolerans]|uniref:Uncharacterized protein n=1 Tax=Sulfobacillus thermotolerans TaxID=338644 RepID=A0ABM6RP09_9FIRM|nr:hypothetical protein BXT84_03030 [Sulfobacillus thermotolerans]